MDCSEIWPRTFSDEKPTEAEFQPIEDENTLIKGASLVTQKHEWLNVGKVKNGFINFQAQLSSRCPICEVIYEKDQLYGFFEKMDVLCLSAIARNNTSQITKD